MVRVAPSYGGGFQDEEDTTFRRYSSREHGYPLLHDRGFPVASHDVYPGSRSHHPSPRETRAVRQSPETDSSSRPRSRIPVACGRCRKRKIKCSGDTGGPCQSCISAGNDSCQFLRVLSEPATLKNECATYDFDPSGGAASRLNCRTGTMPFGAHAFAPQPAPLPLDGYQYRNNSLSTYPYTIKPYYPMSSYGDFGEEGVDYSLQTPLLGNDHLGLTSNYVTSSAGRSWAPQMPKTPLYVEQSETPYNHNQLPYHGYPIRMSSNSEMKHGSLNGMGTSLPPPPLINGNVDRMLPPVPSTNNRIAQIGSYLRSNDGLPVATTLQSQSQPYPDFTMVRNGKHHNNNAISDNSSLAAVSYLPMSSTSPESPSSSQMAYGSQPSMSMSQHSDIYTPPSTDGLCTNESPSESSYGHISGDSKRGSHSSHASSGDGLLPPLQNSSPVNDREYHYAPAPNNGGYYPMPPIHQSIPVSARPSISVGGDQE